ncbi:MAG TPA: hypothetical protein VF669_00790 [Tepidisphaeraceae bacterium]
MSATIVQASSTAAAEGIGRRRNVFVPVTVALLMLAGGTLRYLAAQNAFWFDEILSWKVAREAPHAADILVNTPLDNSHPLNTLWMYGLGDRSWWPAYRLLSVVSGTMMIIAMGRAAGRRDVAASLFATLLAAFSIFQIHYASEARGYAPAMLFAVFAFALTGRFLERPKRRYSLAFALCAMLGLLSHTSFLCVFVALIAWSGAELLTRLRFVEALPKLFRLHGIPLTFTLMYGGLVLRRLTPAGGAPYSPFRAARDALSWSFNWPDHRWMTWSLCAAVTLTAMIEITRMLRERDTQWIFYVTAILVAPMLTLLLWRQPFVYPRYFAVATPFVLILVARFLSRAWRGGGPTRIGAAIFLALFLWGGAKQYAQILDPGRGQYLPALEFILSRTTGPVTVGSHQDLRNTIMFDFYGRYLPAERDVKYIPQDQWDESPPQWLIIDCLHNSPPRSSSRTTSAGIKYHLVRTFRYAGLSGFDWWIFERDRDENR